MCFAALIEFVCFIRSRRASNLVFFTGSTSGALRCDPNPKLDMCLRQYPERFCVRMLALLNELMENKSGAPLLPESLPEVPEILEGMAFTELWAEAEMAEVVRYLRGGRGLQLPPQYRSLFPDSLPAGMA